MANDQQNGGGKQYNGAPLGGVRIAKRGRDTDPASKIPGMPPNMGMDVVPHIDTFSGRIGSYAQTYRNSDEAIKHSVANAEAMRNDCGIMECVEARQRATALLPWHLEPDDPENPEQAALAEMLQRILEAIPRFTEYRMNLMHAVWYGRYGVAQRFRWMDVRGQQVIGIDKWRPIHGDKLIFRYDDGDHTVDEDQIGIRVGGMFNAGQKIGAGEWELQEVSQVLPTDTGLAYFLEPYERPLVAIHKHMIEDGPFELPIDAGAIHGRGIRSRIYWTWFHMQECLSWLLEYLERSAFGIEVWYYAWGNEESRAATETAARKRLGAGRNILLVPRPIGDDAPAYGVEHVEPGMAGASEVRSIVEQYFGWRIKRYILGQILTSETDATGLGSSVADLHKLTFDAIIEYDARNLEETITRDCLKHIQRFNAPGSEGVNIRFKIDTKSDDALEKMQMFEAAWNMGFMLDAKDVGKLVGAKPAQEQTPYLLAPQYIQMQMQLAQMAAPQQQPGQQPGQPAQGGQSIDPAALQAIMAQAGIQPGTPDAAMLEQAAAQAGGSTPQAVASGLQYFSRASNSLRIRNQAKNLHGQIERFALKKNIASPAVAAAPGQPLAAGPGGDSSSGVAPAAEKYAATQPSSPSPWSHAAANVWPGLMTPDQFIDGEAWLKHRLKPYLDDLGNQIASSRETPSTFTMPPIGSWRIDPMKLSHGRMIDQLVVLNPHSLEATEDLVPTNAEGRGWDSDRYREWLRQGKESPPITVVQTDEGTLRVVDGHRRLHAHRRLNKPIKAWVSWAAHIGQNDSQGKPMGTNLTYELAQQHGPAVLMHPQATSTGVAKYAAGEADTSDREEPMPVKDILKFFDLDSQKPRSRLNDQRALLRAAREIAIHHAMHPRGSAEELALAEALHHAGRFVNHLRRGMYSDSFSHKRLAEEILRGYESGNLPGKIERADEVANMIRAGKYDRNAYRAYSQSGQTNLASAGHVITPGAMILAANRLPDHEISEYWERPGQSDRTWDTPAAVDYYRGSGHRLINGILREGFDTTDRLQVPPVINHLDDLISHPASAIRRPMTVYRGFGSKVHPEKIGIGGAILDAGYPSTTADPLYAASYSGEAKDYGDARHIAAIHLPEGTQAPYISEHDGAENELLLPRGAKFTKTGEQETPPGYFDPKDGRQITIHHFAYEPIGRTGRPGPIRHSRQDDSDSESRFAFGNGVTIVPATDPEKYAFKDPSFNPNDDRFDYSDEQQPDRYEGGDVDQYGAISDEQPQEPEKGARAWHFTRDGLAEAINAHDRPTLEAARPLLADMFPEYTADYDPWGIHRAIHRGDELPRIPMVQFTAKHKKLVLDAIARGEHVPPNVAAEYQSAPEAQQ